MTGPAPLSVVVPAHDEERVLGRCLDALARQVDRYSVEVVVVANGCTDRTADVAREHPLRPTVLDLAIGSKHAALNAGDAAVKAFPRLYLDADVVLSDGAVDALHDVLMRGSVQVAAPRPEFVLENRPWVVRAYYRTWLRLPFLNEQPIGNGLYAVSAAGRRRWQTFPPIMADDLYVLRLFAEDERRCVPEVHFLVQTPLTLRDLLSVRTRAYLGDRQLAMSGLVDPPAADAVGGADEPAIGSSRIASVLALARSARGLPDVLAYALVSAWAARRASRRWRLQQVDRWDRDASTR